MFITPLTLIDETIDRLQTLTELLADEADERMRSEPAKPEANLCKEALLTIGVLLPKLQAVRRTPVAMATEYPRTCSNCDDF